MNSAFLHHFRVSAVRAVIALAALLPAVEPAVAQSEPSGFTIGFEQRVRNERWSNIMDFSDRLPYDRNQIRWRTRLWTNIPLHNSIDVFVGLDQETNQIVSPRRPWRTDEVIVENAYIDIKRLFSPEWSLRAGRQNIMLGEGFLILEGGPWDGSRAIYFNAVNLARTTGKSKLQLMAMADPSTESMLPHVHCQNRSLVEWDENAAGVYYTSKHLRNTLIDVYGIWKREFNDRRSPLTVQFQPDKRVNTAGVRVTRRLGKSYAVAGEFALQSGRQSPGTPVKGHAGYAYVKRTFANWRQAYVQAGYWGFSGDDPKTAVIEDWDPLFARWPKWSELYIYSQFHERGVGYWTNLGMTQFEGGFSPVGKVKARATYYSMHAFHPFTRGNPTIFGYGSGRGDNFQVRGDISVNRNWSGHALYEHHLPGNFYSRRTPGHFIRFEILFSWSRTWRNGTSPAAAQKKLN
jgi:hypothetical protein